MATSRKSPAKPVVPPQVIELLPTSHVPEWPGFAEVVLRHDELVNVVENRDALVREGGPRRK